MEKVCIEVRYCKTHELCRRYYTEKNKRPGCGDIICFKNGKGKVMEVDGTDVGYLVFVEKW